MRIVQLKISLTFDANTKLLNFTEKLKTTCGNCRVNMVTWSFQPFAVKRNSNNSWVARERLPFVWKNRLLQWENKWNGAFQRKFSGKKVIPSKVLLFSRFDRFNRNFLYHLFALLVPGSSARARNIASSSPSNGNVIHGLFVLFFIQLASRLPCTQL